MILVDTTVWIDYFNKFPSPQAQQLTQWIEKGEDLCLTEIIITEILQGINDDKIYKEISEVLLEFTILHPKGVETYLRSAELYRTSRKQGISIRKTIDCLIAAIAEENDVYLYHKDKDFDRLANISKIKVLNK